jgi:hypothetical protein
LVLWTQHRAKAEEAVGKEALITREAARRGLRPRKMVFLEKSIKVILSYCALIIYRVKHMASPRYIYLGRGGLAVKYDTDSTTLGKDTKAWAGLCASTSFS